MKHFLIAALAVAGLAACTDKEEETKTDEGGASVETPEAPKAQLASFKVAGMT